MRTTLAVLGITGLALGAAVLAAQPPGADGPGGPGGPRMRRAEGMARTLGLSEEQKAQVEKLVQAQRPKHEALRQQIEQNDERLGEALEAGSPDPLSVGELAIEGHRLRQEGKALREEQDKAVRALLTPEQQAKFDAMKALREDGRRMGKGRPGRGPAR
ncbi:MAG TPA: periplasmic heavy metal sensor [Vicinamibacteria bacterium]